MFRIAVSALAFSALGTLAVTVHADGDRPGPSVSIEVAAVAPPVPQTPPPNWGAPPINPAATIKTALIDFGPIPAPQAVPSPRRSVAPIHPSDKERLQPPTYTMHPAAPPATRMVPVRLGDGFSADQRGQIIQALKEWNQVLNGFVRLQIVGDSQTATGTWFLRAVRGAGSAADPERSLQTLAYTQPLQAGGGTILVYMDRIGSVDLAKVMRHEFGHALGLPHDPRGGVMAAHYSEHAQQCIDRHTAAAVATAWRLPPGDLNWCEHGLARTAALPEQAAR